MTVIVGLIFIGTLFFSVHSLSIRDFKSEEIDDDVPDHSDYAAVARYVVHKSEWTAMGTNSIAKNITGFPMVNVKSIADSAKGEPSTGVIYFYLANEDFTAQDLLKDNRLTVLFSNEQDSSCSNKGVDPMEPTCARVMISGKAVKLDIDSVEYKFGNRAFLSRHPAAQNWIKHHNFYLCKVDIAQIIVIDWYGGANYVEANDYYNVKSDALNDYFTKSNRNANRESFTVNKNEDKIHIKIKKGNDTVFLEF